MQKRDLATYRASKDALQLICGRDLLLRFLVTRMSPLWIGVAIFVIGFGALSIWYLILILAGSPLMQLRGLFDYYASTIGDSILIPIAAALVCSSYIEIAYIVSHALESTEKKVHIEAERVSNRLQNYSLVVTSYLISLLVVFIIHLGWLRDPNTQLNWTIPIPHILNAPGIYHALFFFIVLWWFIAFVLRLSVALPVLLAYAKKKACPYSMIKQAYSLWEKLNISWFVLIVFAVLLYVDSFGTKFTWKVFFSASGYSTIAMWATLLLILILVNLFFEMKVFYPFSKHCAVDYRQQVKLMHLRNLLTFFIGIIFVFSSIGILLLSRIIFLWPLPSFFWGIGISILIVETTWADLFANQGRGCTATGWLAIAAIGAVALFGFLLSLSFALEFKHSVQDLSSLSGPWWKSAVSAFMGIFLSFATVACPLDYLEEKLAVLRNSKSYITDEPPAQCLFQNFCQYWAIHQFVGIPSALFVYKLQYLMESSLSAEAIIALLYGYSATVAAGVAIPLRNNYLHKRDLEKRKEKYSTFATIANHITFQTIWTAALVAGTAVWLWFQTIDGLLRH